MCAELKGAGDFSDARDPVNKGTARLDMAGTVIRFSIAAPGLETVTATHIHHGAAGVNGPMVWEINPGYRGDAVRGAAEGIPPGLIAGIAQEPAEYYVKLHTRQFPGGAIRGQLAPCPAGETILSNSVR